MNKTLNKKRTNQKYTIEEVKQSFFEKGYTLLSSQYINSKAHLEYKCPSGHMGKIRFGDFVRGQGCKKCFDIKNCDRRKKPFEEVKQAFTERGYELLSSEYKSNKTHLEYKCHEGHLAKITFNCFSKGKGCRKCADIKHGNRCRKPFEEVKQVFTDRGYELLSTVYINTDTHLKYRCPKRHLGKITFHSFSSGQGCAKCADIKNGDRCRKTFDDVKQVFTDRGYTLLSTVYKDNKIPLDYRCPEGHLGKIRFNSFSRGHGCAKCSQSRSEKLTREIFERIMSVEFPTVRPDFLKNHKTDRNLELDGYNENLKLAFEYNGKQHYKFLKYFHERKEDFKIQREHDEFKYKKCLELGITLISIPYTFDCYNPEKLEIFIKDEMIKHKFIFFL